jgi:hypothetical protein
LVALGGGDRGEDAGALSHWCVPTHTDIHLMCSGVARLLSAHSHEFALWLVPLTSAMCIASYAPFVACLR